MPTTGRYTDYLRCTVGFQLSLQVDALGLRAQDALVGFSYRALDAKKNPVSFTVQVVIPEPSTWPLWIVGACLLLLIKRRLRSALPVAIRRK